MATGLVVAEFNSPTPNNLVTHKDLVNISYISRVIADFVPNFLLLARYVPNVTKRSI